MMPTLRKGAGYFPVAGSDPMPMNGAGDAHGVAAMPSVIGRPDSDALDHDDARSDGSDIPPLPRSVSMEVCTSHMFDTDPDDVELAGKRDEACTPEDAGLVPRWLAWPGNNRFFLNGRFMTGPEPFMLVCTPCVLVFPVVLFLVGVLPSAYKLLAPWPLLGLPAVILLASALTCFFQSACTEPGIIPRQDPKRGYGGIGTPPARLEQHINGVKVNLRWCSICEIYRPPRSKHCAFCNNCVLRFDHHCPWVSNCVGLRNYRYFVGFVLSTFSLALYVFSIMLAVIVRNIHNSDRVGLGSVFWALGSAGRSAVGLVLFTGCVLCPLGNLVVYHLYLISTNATTNEEITMPYNGQNPFDLGIKRNIKQFFCRPDEPTLVSPSTLVPSP